MGLAAIVVLLLTASVLAYATWPLVSAYAIKPGPAPKPVDEAKLTAKLAEYNELLTKSTAAVVKRAPFGETKVEVKARPVDKPKVVDKYSGPALVGIVEDFAWFGDGKRIKLGEESGDIKVLALDPPWAAKLAYKGAEFKVTLFDRNPISLTQSMSVWMGAPPPEPPKPPPAPVAAAPGVAPGTTPAPAPGTAITPGTVQPGVAPAPGSTPAPPGTPVPVPPGGGQTTVIVAPSPQPAPPPPPPPSDPDGKQPPQR